jgi:methylmalonyl-CoA mutase
VTAFGSDDPSAAVARIHVRTSRANKSVLDSYTNLLRVTTEAMSAVLGGCDSLTIEPFGFDAHLALNVQRILREEASLSRVADPAGGSYYVEALTDSLAREAWKFFQKIEFEGGYSATVNAGLLERVLAQAREAKAKAVSARRRTLVGVNNFPNTAETNVDFAVPDKFHGDPLPQTRLAEPFEQIRARTIRHANAKGRLPKLLLLRRGDLKMKMARANFCLNFFGCAGFEIVESEQFTGTGADLIVLCSSDPEYVALAKEVCPAVTVPVLVAGNPKEQIPELEATGVQGFVHILSDAVETLTYWQNRLGMSEVTERTR